LVAPTGGKEKERRHYLFVAGKKKRGFAEGSFLSNRRIRMNLHLRKGKKKGRKNNSGNYRRKRKKKRSSAARTSYPLRLWSKTIY